MNSTVYVNKQGSCIKQSGKKIIATYEDEKLFEVPTIYLDKIMIFGNVQVNSQTLSLLLNQGVNLSYLTYDGRIKGNLISSKSKNINIRLKQYELFRKDEIKLNISKKLIYSKLSNQIELIKKFLYNYKELNCDKEIESLEKIRLKIKDSNSKEELLGYEGSGSRIYFSAFKKMIRNESFIFTGRKHFPSPDPINAMLSLGYVLVTNEILSLLDAFGIDPYLGFLHEIKYGRESLALDLVEEFRQPLVDSFILKLINRKEFSPQDFEKKGNGAVYFLEDKCKDFFRKYEEHINQKLSNDKSWRDIIRIQVEKFEEYIVKDLDYNPFLFDKVIN